MNYVGQSSRLIGLLKAGKTAYEMSWSTVLYVLREDYSDIEACIHDKDLVQRLETTLIHWIHQIKEVLKGTYASHSSTQSEDKGLLAEIEF